MQGRKTCSVLWSRFIIQFLIASHKERLSFHGARLQREVFAAVSVIFPACVLVSLVANSAPLCLVQTIKTGDGKLLFLSNLVLNDQMNHC